MSELLSHTKNTGEYNKYPKDNMSYQYLSAHAMKQQSLVVT